MTEHVDNADVRIHPPILMFFHLLAAILLGWLLPIPLPGWASFIGWGVLLAGLGAAFAAVREFSRTGTTLSPHATTTAMVRTGVYRFTRNPIYLGYLCAIIGFPSIFGNLWGLLVSPVQVVLFNKLIIEREEAYLARKFGQEYLDYKKRVRRWGLL